jgi:hypothetical protein
MFSWHSAELKAAVTVTCNNNMAKAQTYGGTYSRATSNSVVK